MSALDVFIFVFEFRLLLSSLPHAPMPRTKPNTRLHASRRKHPLTEDKRNRIVSMYESSLRSSEITERMKEAHEQINRHTVRHFLSRYRGIGKVQASTNTGRGKAQATSTKVEQKIVELVNTNNELTGPLIQFALNDSFESNTTYHTPTLQTVYKILHKHNFTRKVLRNTPAAYNSDSTKHARFRYACDIAQPLLTPDNSIFIDETPFASHQHRTHGWSLKGTPARRITSTATRNNHSMIAAMPPRHGLVHYKIKETEKDDQYQTKGVGEQAFKEFIKELLAKPLFKERECFYFCVMDNVSFHKCESIRILINRKHKHTLLSPYSPFLNPIEHL